MKLRPLKNKVLVKRVPIQERTAGGLYLADVSKEKPSEATVEAVGSEVKDVAPGDRVLFGKYTGSTQIVDGVEYLVMAEGEILGVLT